MDPNMNVEPDLPAQSGGDPYPSFSSDSPTVGQDAAIRSSPQGHFAGPYPNSNPRGRQHGEFHQRGRYMYNRRGGGNRSSHRGRNPYNHYQQQQQQQQQHEFEATGGNEDPMTTTATPANRSFNKYFRPTMLEDPWSYLQPRKVPPHGQSLIFDSAYH